MSQVISNLITNASKYSSENTRTQSGTGIGLYFCRMIVEYHSGEITAQSESDQGTVITLRLPREFASVEIDDSLAA